MIPFFHKYPVTKQHKPLAHRLLAVIEHLQYTLEQVKSMRLRDTGTNDGTDLQGKASMDWS